MRQILLPIVFLIVAVARTAAAFTAPDFNFIHYSTENGLPSNSVRDIVQDDEGYMWFATDGGLVRFDGSTSKVFLPDVAGEPDFFMLSLCNSPYGLLVGSDSRLYCFDRRKETLGEMRLKYPDSISERIEGAVLDVCVDSAGEVWVSVDQKGVFRISARGEVLSFQEFPQVMNFIGMLYVDPSDIVWGVSTADSGGIFKYDRSKSRFEEFQITIDGAEIPCSALAVMCDSHGDYWLGTWESGIIKFNGRTGEGVRILDSTAAGKVWHVHSITEYSPSMIFVGSDSGLTLIDSNTGEYKVYKSDELNLQSLTDRFVYPVTKDADGGFWIGTYYRGVNYLSSDFKRFRRWRHSRFANSVCGNVIARFCEDGSGNIWIGSADGGVCRYNPAIGLFSHFPLVSRHENDNVNALVADGDRIWVGTYTKGTGILDPRTGDWKRIPVENDYSYSSYAICKDSEGAVWMASTETLTKYNEDKERFEKIGNFGAWITDLDEDREGFLWISTQGNGLFRMDTSTGKTEHYTASNSPVRLPHNHINSVTVGDNGEVYVATIYGVSRYDSATGTFEDMTAGIPNVSAQSVQQTGSEMWIATLSGLVLLKPDGEYRTFTYSDGLSDNQFLPGASLRASDGKIYYGTVNGFCCVDPLAARTRQEAPRIKFTGLDIVNVPVEVGDPRLPESLNNMDELTLTHADHTFSIYFSALSYANTDGNVYKYCLEGFDKSWHSTGKERRATYSNLPAGTYTLRVKAANSDGVWNEDGISLRIRVKPAWYLSTIMKALYVIAGAVLLILCIRYVLWRMERNHISELDRISSNKEKEMFRSKLKFFTVVAHEIRTPVSLIIGPLEKILESPEKFSPEVREDLSVIERNSQRLLSLVNQLLDFKKVEDNALPVGFRNEDITALIENVTDRFRPSLEQKGIRLHVSCPERDSLRVDVDPEALTKLVSNLLNNARKFTKSEITLKCRALPDGKRFTISVEDNGIGINRENRDKIFKPFFQVLDNINDSRGGTGLGLSIVKSVVDAHGGSVEVDSSPGKGARFIVTLPIRQENVLPTEKPEDAGHDQALQGLSVETHEEGAKPVLLVVDDNEEMVRFISKNFESRYTVVTAFNGKEALGCLAAHAVSLIICDWMMPEMDGVEFLRRVRENENYCHIPFVMLTAKTDNLSKVETMKSGADLYIEKPFSVTYLDACIDNLLEMRTMLKKKYSDEPLQPISTLANNEVDNDFLSRLQKLIEDNFSNPDLNVDFLANHLGISRSGLYAKISTLAAVTPKELIQITRLKKGAELLKEGKYQVSDIAYMVGYGSSSYFSKCFYKQFGVRPADLAKMSKKSPGNAGKDSDR